MSVLDQKVIHEKFQALTKHFQLGIFSNSLEWYCEI